MQADSFRRRLQGLPAEVHRLLALGLEVVRDEGAGAVRLEEFDPFRLGLGILGRDDFHLVSGLEDVVQRDQFLVHLGGDGLVAWQPISVWIW